VTHARFTDTRLRELYERRLGASDAGRRQRCASPEDMLALVRQQGTEEERLGTLDHVMACGDCIREFELLRSLERAGVESSAAEVGASQAATESGADVVPLRPRPSWRRFAPLALAASVVLAVGVALFRGDGQPGMGDVARGGEAAVTLLAPGMEVAAGGGAPLTFVWRPVAGTVRYELEVLEASGAAAFSATTADTVAAIPEPRRLTPGVEYRWWVRAVDAAGAQRASEMRRLRVRSE
jgi:hypothetical protein